MKALLFDAPRTLRIGTLPDPEILHPEDAVLRVELTAVCGSDLHVYRGHEQGLDAGTCLGHEFLGTVLEVGSAVERFRPGDRVVSPFSTSCGRCFYCERGLTSRCERGELYGWLEGGRGLHGAQAELARVPLADGTLVPVPDDLPLEAALFTGDILSTGYFCADNGGVGPGSSVAVLGCGPVGLLAIAAAFRLGAARVFAVDSIAERLTLAEGFGARPVPLEAEPAAVIRRATDGRGVDVVLEAVGHPSATRLGYELVRHGGTISAAGVHNEEHFAFSPGAAYDKNLTYKAGRAPARHYMEPMLAWIREDPKRFESVISHRLPLEDGVHAYDLFDRKLEGCTKVLLLPSAF